MKKKSIFFVLLSGCLILFLAYKSFCPPTVPVLKSPPDGSGVSMPVYLEWYPSTDDPSKDGCIITYQVEVAGDINFQDVQFDKAHISETTCKVSDLENNTTYYWRVRAHCKEGGNSAWSDVWRFNVVNK